MEVMAGMVKERKARKAEIPWKRKRKKEDTDAVKHKGY